MGGVGSVGTWFRGERESNFDVSNVGGVGPFCFGAGQKICLGVVGRNFSVGDAGPYNFGLDQKNM